MPVTRPEVLDGVAAFLTGLGGTGTTAGERVASRIQGSGAGQGGMAYRLMGWQDSDAMQGQAVRYVGGVRRSFRFSVEVKVTTAGGSDLAATARAVDAIHAAWTSPRNPLATVDFHSFGIETVTAVPDAAGAPRAGAADIVLTCTALLDIRTPAALAETA